MFSNIYVVRIKVSYKNNFIKVGHAKDFESRIASFRTGGPFEVKRERVLRVPSNMARQMEKEIHNALKEFRVRGEWFTSCRKQEEILSDCINKLLENDNVSIVGRKPTKEEIDAHYRQVTGLPPVQKPKKKIVEDYSYVEEGRKILDKFTFGLNLNDITTK